MNELWDRYPDLLASSVVEDDRLNSACCSQRFGPGLTLSFGSRVSEGNHIELVDVSELVVHYMSGSGATDSIKARTRPLGIGGGGVNDLT